MTDTLRIAMIGVGGIAQGHIERLLKLPEIEIAAIADISEQSIQKTRGRFGDSIGGAQIFDDYRRLLETIKPTPS